LHFAVLHDVYAENGGGSLQLEPVIKNILKWEMPLTVLYSHVRYGVEDSDPIMLYRIGVEVKDLVRLGEALYDYTNSEGRLFQEASICADVFQEIRMELVGLKAYEAANHVTDRWSIYAERYIALRTVSPREEYLYDVRRRQLDYIFKEHISHTLYCRLPVQVFYTGNYQEYLTSSLAKFTDKTTENDGGLWYTKKVREVLDVYNLRAFQFLKTVANWLDYQSTEKEISDAKYKWDLASDGVAIHCGIGFSALHGLHLPLQNMSSKESF
jgi:hypothetical protein